MKLCNAVSAIVLLFAVNAAFGHSTSNMMRPSQWMSPSELEQTPSIEEISLENLENMSMEKAAKLMQKVYHLSQINHDLEPNYVPSPSNIPCHIYKPSGEKVTTTLEKLASLCKQQTDFGDREVTVFITGWPATSETVKKANRRLIEAYIQRYNSNTQQHKQLSNSGEWRSRTSSEEDSREMLKQQDSTGDILEIDLGSKLNSFKHLALLDTERTGAMIASAMIKLNEMCNVADKALHIVAQGIAAHVAGAAGNEYTRQTGRQLRRITALDPSKMFAKNRETVAGLSRGDAEFVDAIHTSAYGMGTIQRVGDVDFYPNGPSNGVPGAKNIIEASMRATRYFAESVRPGQERNFPAVSANSLMELKNNDGYSKRVYMGIDADFDAEGDFMLEVNSNSPFGKRTTAHMPNNHHGVHKAWKKPRDDEWNL